MNQIYSQSKLNCFLNCKKQYYFQYVKHYEILKSPEMELGNQIDEAILKTYKDNEILRPVDYAYDIIFMINNYSGNFILKLFFLKRKKKISKF